MVLPGVRFTTGHSGFVGRSNFVCRAVLTDGAAVNPKDALTEASNLIELVGDEDDCAAGAGDVTHLAEAFFLEIDVADGEHLVHKKDFRLEMGGNREG